MKAVISSETLVNFHHTTRRGLLKDSQVLRISLTDGREAQQQKLNLILKDYSSGMSVSMLQ
jgi:hypothetical protein